MEYYKQLRPVIVLVLLLLISACSKPNQLYNYGDYSDSYYEHKKKVTPETELALIESIENVIDGTDKSISKRVPPGMFANLGYLHLQKGDSQKAIDLFRKEKSTYPESSHFMESLITKAEKAMQNEGQELNL